jgi:tetratricopeptide (TPR) repeat protein
MFLLPQPKAQTTGVQSFAEPKPFDAISEMARARREFKPVMIFFYCGDKKNAMAAGCSALNNKVFADESIVKKSAGFLCIAIDFLKLHNSLKIQFKVKTAPTIFFTDAFGDVLMTFTNSTINAVGFKGLMDSIEKRNKAAVNDFKAKMEALKKDFDAADALLNEFKFDDAKKLLDKVAGGDNAELAAWAKSKAAEIPMGQLFQKGLKELEERQFDLAKSDLEAVAQSQIENRWSSRAWGLIRAIPAAKLYYEAVADKDAGKGSDAMDKFSKVMEMEDAGEYAGLAAKKIEEIKAAWGKK